VSDKKISGLTERTTAITGTDLLLLVTNPTTPPGANYKVQVKNFLSQFVIDIPVTAISTFKVTANVVVNSAAIQAAAEFRLNAGNSSIGSSNAYGVLINHNTTGATARATSPRAFIGVIEVPVGGNTTTYLMDVGLQGTANVSANLSAPNSSVILTVANTLLVASANSIHATHLVKCCFNGINLWVLASNVAPA
jgi:hypothetical protein